MFRTDTYSEYLRREEKRLAQLAKWEEEDLKHAREWKNNNMAIKMKQDIDEAVRKAEAKEGIEPVDGKFWNAGYDDSPEMEGKEGQGQGNKGAKAESEKKKDIFPPQTNIKNWDGPTAEGRLEKEKARKEKWDKDHAEPTAEEIAIDKEKGYSGKY